jgi:predicted GIY-YIG superfamily endonuclease
VIRIWYESFSTIGEAIDRENKLKTAAKKDKETLAKSINQPERFVESIQDL